MSAYTIELLDGEGDIINTLSADTLGDVAAEVKFAKRDYDRDYLARIKVFKLPSGVCVQDILTGAQS
jgi:hypothetical protein